MAIAITRPARKPSWWSKVTQKIPLDFLLMLSSSVMFLYVTQQIVRSGTLSPTQLLVYSVWMGMLAAVGYLYWTGSPQRQLRQLQGWLSDGGLLPLAWTVGAVIFMLDLFSLPANAQVGGGGVTGSSTGFFFTNLQTKVTAVFAGSAQADTVTPLVLFTFGVLQILFIMFVGSAREEEDWKQVAKTPIIVVLAIVGGDWAIGLI